MVYIVKDIFILESDEADSHFLQNLLPVFVDLLTAIMNRSVNFDCEFLDMTVEIDNHEPAASHVPHCKWILAYELLPSEFAISEKEPKHGFSRCLILSQQTRGLLDHLSLFPFSPLSFKRGAGGKFHPSLLREGLGVSSSPLFVREGNGVSYTLFIASTTFIPAAWRAGANDTSAARTVPRSIEYTRLEALSVV
jgi:hypothetical protein